MTHRAQGWMLLLCTLLTGRAGAEELPSCQATPTCRQLSEDAKDKFEEGDYEQSRQLIEKAYEQLKDPFLLGRLGLIREKQQQYGAAEQCFLQVLKLPGLLPRQRQTLEEFLRRVRQLQAAATSVKGEPAAHTTAAACLSVRAPTQPAAEVVPAAVPPYKVQTVATKEIRTPIHKRWWFWTIGGAVVVGSALAIGLGVASRDPDLMGAPLVEPVVH